MIIDLPWPHDYLWPNKRPLNKMAIARQTAKHREWANLATLEVKPKCFEHNGEPIPVTLYVYAKPRGPLPDRDNCIAAMKASLDGIADALGVNDQSFLSPTVVFSKPREGRVAVGLFHKPEAQIGSANCSCDGQGGVTGSSA